MISVMAMKAEIKIEELKLGEYITLKILFYDDKSNYIISYYLSIEGEEYKQMNQSQNFDEFIKKFIETKLQLSII
jgi:hypothetical protein